jgi:hypothetical protein
MTERRRPGKAERIKHPPAVNDPAPPALRKPDEPRPPRPTD